ncbi:unnamed protein product [Rhizophagus irregularis]|nr:unnamed protein product [Rhizophagus irregularis]
MFDDADEVYNEFIKEYGERYEWGNEGIPEFTPEWEDWEDLFCEIKIYWKTKAIRHWREKILKKFVYSLPGIRNPASLFHVFIQSNAFYLPQILSLIELPYSAEELRWEIWPDGKDTDEIKVENNADEVDKFRCGSLLQDEDSIVDYYSKIKRCNDVIKLCKNHLKEVFIKGLTPKNKHFALMDFEYIFPPDLPLDVLVIMLIQAEKGTTSKLLLQACLDFISQQQRFAIYKSPIGGLVATQDQLQKSPCEKPTFRKKTFPEKITQNKESEMSDKSKTSDKSKYITLNCIIPDSPPEEHIHVIVKLPLLSLEEALSCIPPPITYSPDCTKSKTTTKIDIKHNS